MYELSNEQRKYFALQPTDASWVKQELKASPYDNFQTFAYIDGTVIRKYFLSGDNIYVELDLRENLSDDLRYLLPKTAKGKPVLLSSSTIQKRPGTGMGLSYGKGYVRLTNLVSLCDYYGSFYDPLDLNSVSDFGKWVEQWCAATTPEDLQSVTEFAAQKRKHVKFQEGDVFRYKINRRLYGYGRILLDYDKMRKRKEPFWDVLMTKPVVCAVYHIVTENPHLSVRELEHLPSLPSHIVTDNDFFYGEYEIIGNIPIGEKEDYPILYGNSIHVRDHAVCFQCGKFYWWEEQGTALFKRFINNGVAMSLRVWLPVLQQCIQAGSNDPFWVLNNGWTEGDLRNPKYRSELAAVCRQVGIDPSSLIHGYCFPVYSQKEEN